MECKKLNLALPKGKQVKKPERTPDYYSKRGVAYWWAPEWTRGTDGTNTKFGRIFPLKVKRSRLSEEDVELQMVSKDGNLSYIQGSIQDEFKRWHTDNQLDYILLGMDYSEAMNVKWEYE